MMDRQDRYDDRPLRARFDGAEGSFDPQDERFAHIKWGFREIADHLEYRIIAGKLEGFLPPVNNLAYEYGVANQTMQRAIMELSGKKIVAVSRGRRTRIIYGADYSFAQALEMVDEIEKKLDALKAYLTTLAEPQYSNTDQDQRS